MQAADHVIDFTAKIESHVSRRHLQRKVEEAQRQFIDAEVESAGPSWRADASAAALRYEGYGERIGKLAADYARAEQGQAGQMCAAERIKVAAIIAQAVQAFDPSTADAQNIMEAAAMRECGL